MAKFEVNIQSYANAIVKVELSDEALKDLADDLDVNVEDLSVDDLHDLLYENMETPTICAQCSGWGQINVSLDLGDEWTIDDDKDSEGNVPTNPDHRSIRKLK